jgi:hypothetical protein
MPLEEHVGLAEAGASRSQPRTGELPGARGDMCGVYGAWSRDWCPAG